MFSINADSILKKVYQTKHRQEEFANHITKGKVNENQ